jgi:hypothetical protein
MKQKEPSTYSKWSKNGYLTLTEGTLTDPKSFFTTNQNDTETLNMWLSS